MQTKTNHIKLIALDIDGTLLTSHSTISKETKRSINQAVDRNVVVVLSTGRPIYGCYQVIEMLQLNTYFITASGGEIWTADMELIEQNLFNASQVESLSKLGNDIGVNQWITSTKREFRNEKVDRFSDHEWLKIGFYSKNKDKLNRLKEELKFYEGLEIANSHPSNIEVSPAGVHKAEAIKKVGENLGITMAEVMAVGDSLNDAEMIQKSGLGVAMGNAQQAIKDIADYITDTNDNDGVSKAIERFVL